MPFSTEREDAHDVNDLKRILVSPDGSLIECNPLISGLRKAYGLHRDTDGGFAAIDIRNVHIRFESEHAILATYEQWQRSGDTSEQGRLSTALFTQEKNAPKGQIWQHVHETWLRDGA